MKGRPEPIIPDEEFAHLFTAVGPQEMATRFKCQLRAIYARRKRLEANYKIVIDPPAGKTSGRIRPIEHPYRLQCEVKDGVVLIGSDAHIWPGDNGPAIRAFTKFCKGVDGEKPKVVILNGDVMDFPNVSRHPPIGWETCPDVAEEMDTAKAVLEKIEKSTFKARKIWTLGNHDARFETRLATVAPEYAKIHGVHLRDHFPLWEPAWSVWINDDTVVKHRYKGGVHATHNNTVNSGTSIITGHLHSAKVTPYTDYKGTRYGVDTGCLAHTDARQFVDYTEDNPKSWISGFCLLTFIKGRLMFPELITVWDADTVQFRGKLIKV